MNNEKNAPPEKDPRLWAIAERRTGFKREFVTYVVINAFLWILWLLTGAAKYKTGIPWPVWPTLGWGIAIVIRYFEAYRFPKENAVEKEYDKLKRNQ
ncbi:MAG: 2TM domain-containing protein [Chitinophagaceae bacterium]|nr:2TM domain-containing protein [Chitinophagaceae bacterium]